MPTNFDPNECANLDQSTKIGPNENKVIHSMSLTEVNCSPENFFIWYMQV